MQDQIKRMDLGEFRDLGYLQEVNRQFLHPLGLALEMAQQPDGSWQFGGVWDYRDDPEGIVYDGPTDPDKTARVDAERERHAQARIDLLGSVIQPGSTT